MRHVTPLLLALAFLACGGRATVVGAPDGGAAGHSATIADSEIGLDSTELSEVAEPLAPLPDLPQPGEVPSLPRPFDGAPPDVPHAVADFVPITLEENLCLECHQVEEKLEGEPTPVPPSHYRDLRNAPNELSDAVAGARYHCTTCHAPRSAAPPLVANTFGD